MTPGANICEPRNADCPVAISIITSLLLVLISSKELSMGETSIQSLSCECILTEGLFSLFLKCFNYKKLIVF